MKNILLILLTTTLFTACIGDESSLNDYELFGRLQSGSGTWEIVTVNTRNNTEKSPEIVENTPENAFYHFYQKTKEISGVLVDVNHAVLYQNGSRNKSSDIEAEPLRVVFTNGQVLGGEVWTVKVNKISTQEWTKVTGNTTTTMLLEKCNCDVPFAEVLEQGG